jgi:hypothetical protein
MEKKPRRMKEGSSAVRLLVLLALLVVVAAGSYWKVPAARDAVDEKLPVVKETLARFGAAPDGESAAGGSPEGTPPAPVDPAGLFETLAADPTSWPRTVHLRKAVEFPAVIGGKEFGKVLVKPGSEARLVDIKNGMLGLEYQGGGARVKPDDTDFLQRARPPTPATPAPAPVH